MTPYQSQWMDENLEVFRRSVSQFVETEMLPYDEKWREQQHLVPGSVMAMAPIISPLAIFGSQRCFCSSVP